MGSLWLNSFLKLLSGPETLLIMNPWGPLMTQRPQDFPFYTREKRCYYCLVSLQSVENGSRSQSPSGTVSSSGFSESLLAYWSYGRLAETPKAGAPRLANTRFNNSHDIKETATLTTPLVGELQMAEYFCIAFSQEKIWGHTLRYIATACIDTSGLCNRVW